MTVHIAALHVYPVKSMRGTEVRSVTLTAAGFADDRDWMVVTPTGRFLTQREVPRLALIQPMLSTSALLLRAEGAPDFALPLNGAGGRVNVHCWNDNCRAFDEGDAVASWLAAILHRECRLARFDPSLPRLSPRRWTGDIEAENRFTDGFPLLTLSTASLGDLNSRLPRPLPMNRFRPNLVLEGLPPYGEDRIDELVADAVRLKLVKPCTRCRITTTDQDTAALDGDEPLRTLKSYRYDAVIGGVMFGQNTIVVALGGATLHRGQEVQVRWRAPDI